jgi:predicted MPP superfamily phosphohydrolase
MKLTKLIKIILLLITTSAVILGYSHIESRWIKLKKIEIISADIPASFNNKKIVFITDIHHGPFLSIDRVKSLVKRINKLEPDLVLMGGDYVHRDSKYIMPVFNELEKLNSKNGIYAVLGNHDHWEDAELTKRLMIRNNIKICDNNSFWVKQDNDSIKIGGVGDLWEDSQIIDNTINDLKETDFAILISHNPDFIEKINTDKIDLTLCGHTHGGQVTLFGLWAPILPIESGNKYRYGLKEIGKMRAYISSGIGTITPPLRLFCRPEIVLINLKKE